MAQDAGVFRWQEGCFGRGDLRVRTADNGGDGSIETVPEERAACVAGLEVAGWDNLRTVSAC
jgi:hypothetical protein